MPDAKMNASPLNVTPSLEYWLLIAVRHHSNERIPIGHCEASIGKRLRKRVAGGLRWETRARPPMVDQGQQVINVHCAIAGDIGHAIAGAPHVDEREQIINIHPT